MQVLRDRRLLLAVVVTAVLAVTFQRQLGDFLWTRTPTFPTSTGIFCGEEVAGHNGPLNVAARECFWAAYEQRRPAEFRTTRPTIEGDPITLTYRIREGGVVEVIIDSRQDTFSNRGITFLECRELVRLDDLVFPDPIDFGPGDGCVERSGS